MRSRRTTSDASAAAAAAMPRGTDDDDEETAPLARHDADDGPPPSARTRGPAAAPRQRQRAPDEGPGPSKRSSSGNGGARRGGATAAEPPGGDGGGLLRGPACPACNDGAFPSAAAHPSASARCRPGVGYAVLFLMLVVAPVTEHGWRVMPGWMAGLLALGGGAELARRIVTFRRWGDEYPYVGRFCLWFALMIAELLLENFMVWVVSATDARKYEDVPALQDNVAAAFDALKARSPRLAAPVLEFRLAGTVHFLCATLALAFSVAWDQVPFSGFGMMARFFATTAVGRLVRVAAFCATVLPNPRPGCYARRFPPPPGTAWGVVREGFRQLRGDGGCNDLVVSGHGAFWTTAPLMFGAFYDTGGARGGVGRAVRVVLWLALAQSALRDALEAFHYSVDMLLAVVVTSAAWSWTRAVYQPSPFGGLLRERPSGAPPDAFRWVVLAPIAAGLVAAGVIVFIGRA